MQRIDLQSPVAHLDVLLVPDALLSRAQQTVPTDEFPCPVPFTCRVTGAISPILRPEGGRAQWPTTQGEKQPGVRAKPRILGTIEAEDQTAGPAREAHRSHGRCARRALTRGANISSVPGNKPLRSRRRLNTLTRKRITSYYTEEEQHEIAHAAARLRMSISGFVAGATLEQARLVNAAKPSSKRK